MLIQHCVLAGYTNVGRIFYSVCYRNVFSNISFNKPVCFFVEIQLEWKGVKSKIIQSNILANNGIIHIIDRILFRVEEEEEESTLPPGSMNTRGVNGASTSFSVLVSYLSVLTTLYMSCLVSR